MHCTHTVIMVAVSTLKLGVIVEWLRNCETTVTANSCVSDIMLMLKDNGLKLTFNMANTGQMVKCDMLVSELLVHCLNM